MKINDIDNRANEIVKSELPKTKLLSNFEKIRQLIKPKIPASNTRVFTTLIILIFSLSSLKLTFEISLTEL
jgi:hypothetical protein